ncbi:sulfotransferase [Streptosporangium sp. DT93]|uniref:sulfotransferase n=1 Tax=Streptosporangium sp. DT93 TaxID=3393428 RepID=UPI003CE9D3ED
MSVTGAPPLVLLGAQRSGTTALAAVLDRAFDAVGGLFTINGKLPYLLHRWCTEEDLSARHLRVDEMLHALRRRPPYGRASGRWLATVEEVLREAAAEVAAGRVEDAVTFRRDLVNRAYRGATRFGEKYNEYLLELDRLDQTVPDAHWVLLVRHPAAVAASTLRWSGDRPWRPATWEAALDKWVAWHEPWLRHGRTRDPARRTVLEYDRLCAGEDLARLSAVADLDLVPIASLLARRPPPEEPEELPPHVERVWRALLDSAGPGRS